MRDCKRVLAAPHTMAYAQRLSEVFSLLESDFRVEVLFTVPPHAFGEGVEHYLRGLGITVIDWEKVLGTEFDLALVAGSRGIDQIRAPLLRLSHGAGQIKLLRKEEQERESAEEREAEEPYTEATGGASARGRPAAMLSREYLVRDGRVVPAALVFSHEEELRTLEWSCPEALPVASVVGDPCRDRIVASLPRREEYRRAMGLADGERLVVVTSTWGRSSSFGRFDALLPRLLGELPAGYRTAVLVHPNVWAGHGPWQVNGWLAGCRRRGVAVVPPEADWMAPLVAADWIIGDHGSVTAYGALTGAPVLLARFPESEVAPDSPAALLARTAPALSPVRPLQEQLQYAAEEYRPEGYRAVTARLSSEPGLFHRHMRTLMYRLLGLSEPAYPPVVETAPLPAEVFGRGGQHAEGAAE